MAIQNDGGGRGGRRGTGGSFSTRRGTGGSFTSTPRRAAMRSAPKIAPTSFSGGGDTGGGGGYDGGGYDGGGYDGGGGAVAPQAIAAPPPPTPIKDVDWFEQDGIYRGSAGRNLADLTSQLAQILADRDAGYRQLDTSRGELTRGRQEDLTDLGNDFAGRGLGASGLFAQSDDRVQADYTRQNSALDSSANQLSQQFGNRGAQVDLSGLQKGNVPANLASIYGLLGAMGTNAGNNYNSAMSKARAESASRATAPLIQTTTW